ncbi:hypothetical protein KTU01_15880 [Kocuria turfanensis]|uniref:Uncharacterized protein n=2 Tax=Kocuria turfanensis TaxID=388357 RepID=A0A512ICN4_9MICC|nr:hypothetical protein KTU01_15880 [Kocuria turfanensis]
MSAASIGALVVALTGCGEDAQEVDADYAQICVQQDPETGEDVRVDDDECDDAGRPRGSFIPMFLFLNAGRSFAVPPVGSPVPPSSGFTTTRPPASATVARGFAPSGTSVGRSGVSKGFGGSSSGWGS